MPKPFKKTQFNLVNIQKKRKKRRVERDRDRKDERLRDCSARYIFIR